MCCAAGKLSTVGETVCLDGSVASGQYTFAHQKSTLCFCSVLICRELMTHCPEITWLLSALVMSLLHLFIYLFDILFYW
jgi:uncharacterized membrane protein